MNIETIDVASLRLPRTPRRPLAQRDTRWIDDILQDVDQDAINSSAAPDRLAGPRDLVTHNGRRLLAA